MSLKQDIQLHMYLSYKVKSTWIYPESCNTTNEHAVMLVGVDITLSQ